MSGNGRSTVVGRHPLVKKAVRELRRRGYELEHTGNGHIKVRLNGSTVTIFSAKLGERNAEPQFRRQMRELDILL